MLVKARLNRHFTWRAICRFVCTSSIMFEIIIGTKNILRKILQKNETLFLCSYTCPLILWLPRELDNNWQHYMYILKLVYSMIMTGPFANMQSLKNLLYSINNWICLPHVCMYVYGNVCHWNIVLHKSKDTSFDLTEYILILLELFAINSCSFLQACHNSAAHCAYQAYPIFTILFCIVVMPGNLSFPQMWS